MTALSILALFLGVLWTVVGTIVTLAAIFCRGDTYSGAWPGIGPWPARICAAATLIIGPGLIVWSVS